MIAALSLPQALREQLKKEAFAALPKECCGLIEGVVQSGQSRVDALHPVRNLAQEADAFAIDPIAHIALRRRLRKGGSGIIGCYHSHPNGKAEPSLRDQAQASEGGFLWLIVACDGLDCELGAFVRCGSGFMPVRLN